MTMLNIKDFITEADIETLKKLLLRKQKMESNLHFIELEVCHNQSATPLDTLEIRARYTANQQSKPRLRLNVKENKLRLIEVYLLVEGEGTGSMIINYLIEIAKRNDFNQFEIHHVQHDNIDYKAYNLGMKQEGTYENGNYFYNYILDLK